MTLIDTTLDILLDRFYDDASLFPPAELTPRQAVPAHVAHLASSHAAVVGPFVASVAVLPGLPAAMAVAVAGPVSHVVAALSAQPSAHVTSIEVSGPLGEALAVLAGRPGYVEVPLRRPAAEVSTDLAMCADAGTAVKFRTGGMTSEAFPTEAELAVGLHECAARRLPFKLTAGLHDPVRHGDPVTGFQHHGLLNVVLAVDLAQRGGTVDQIEAVLTEADGAAVVGAVRELSRETMTTVRGAFRSVGTCSIDECLAGLAATGLTLPARAMA